MYEDMLPVGETIDTATLGRLMNRVRMGYYPTDLEHVQMIRKSRDIPGKARSIFSIRAAGKGWRLKLWQTGKKP